MDCPFAGATQVEAATPLAIVGMACRLPGASDLAEFWEMLVEGRCAIGELPPERLDRDLYYAPQRGMRGKTYSTLGAILTNKDFDRRACPLPESLVRTADSSHLLMCETAARACRHAGLDPFDLPERNTGVFIGHIQGSLRSCDQVYGKCAEEAAQFLREVEGFRKMSGEEQEAVLDEWVASIRSRLSRGIDGVGQDTVTSRVAGLISEAFGLTGPYAAVNSACASSLEAVLLASRALQLGRIGMAIVGGSSELKGDSLLVFSAAQAMSATGSRPFDAEADGLIVSEGYAAIVLKTLPRALADGDKIQAVVRGLGVASDGRGKSLWAPRQEGQMEAMRRAYSTGVEIADLDYLEAHATATQVGDATEVAAVCEVLEGRLPEGKRIPITSLKANIGHALEAAGLAGLIKVVLCLQHRTFVPAVNVRTLNPRIPWNRIPLYVPLTATAWPDPPQGRARRAGINAFGIGGLNMHLVVDEFLDSSRTLVSAPSGSGQRTPSGKVDEAVAIIGMGCVFPGAHNVPAYWELLVSGRDPKGPAPSDRWPTLHRCAADGCTSRRQSDSLGGYVTGFHYDWRSHRIPPKHLAQGDPLQFMLLDAADQALRDAGFDQRSFDRIRTGVLVGTEFAGDFSFQLQVGMRTADMQKALEPVLEKRGISGESLRQMQAQFGDALLAHWPALMDESGSFHASSLASRITKTWDLMGGAAVIDSGDASSLAALSMSIDLLVSGDCDVMICAGAQRKMAMPVFESLRRAGLLAGEHPPRSPFDAEAHGYVPGEGVGVVLLKRLSDARRDGDPIRGILHGVGAAHGSSAGEALRVAMRRSFDISKLSPGRLALLEADGAGVPAIDQDQVEAMAVIHRECGRPAALALGSVVGQIGHTGAASGMASLLKAGLEMEHREVVSTVGLRTPLPAITKHSRILQAAMEALRLAPTGEDRRLLSGVSSYAQGLAYHAILERGSPIPEWELESESRLVARRHVLRMLDAPLPPGLRHRRPVVGPALLLGDTAAARALCRRLTARGISAAIVPVAKDPETAIDAMQRVCRPDCEHGLFLMSGRDQRPWCMDDPGNLEERAEHAFLPYFILQRWMQLRWASPQPGQLTLVAAVSLGGQFGFSGGVAAPEGGALAGLLKSLHVEDCRKPQRTLEVKLIDAPADEPPETLAEAICRELEANQPDVEVAWCGGWRRRVQPVATPIRQSSPGELTSGSVWIVTGGARGITAEAALELGRCCRAKLHLIGSSPLPAPDAPWQGLSEKELKAYKLHVVRQALAAGHLPEEEWNQVKHAREIQANLERFAEAGISATYHRCDVADSRALAEVLERIRAIEGRIDGILHGAGYARPARFEQAQRETIRRTVRPKLEGTLALMTLTRKDPIRWFIAFGSLSGRWGGNGLADYAAANEMMAKLVGWYRDQRPECAATCFHWQTWDQVGMATLSESRSINEGVLQMQRIPPAEGAMHMIRELCGGLPEREVLVTDGQFQRLFGAAPERSTAVTAPSEHSLVRRTVSDGIATLTLNRPETGNALNPALVHRLRQGLAEALADPEVRGIVIVGEGKVFASGADVGFFLRNMESRNWDRIVGFSRMGHQLLEEIEASPKPVVACLHGTAMGAGLELALACHRIIAASRTRLALPEVGLGIYPGMGGTQRTPRRIGVGLAKWLLFTGTTLLAEDGLEIGLVDSVVSAEDLDKAGRQAIDGASLPRKARQPTARFADLAKVFETNLVRDLRQGAVEPAVSPRLARAIWQVRTRSGMVLEVLERLVDEGMAMPLHEALQLEFEPMAGVFATEEARNGLSSLARRYEVFRRH